MSTDLCAAVELHVYNGAGVRQDVTLQSANSIQFTERVAADGTCTASVSLNDPDLVANPDVLESGILRAALVLGEGEQPTEVAGWELVPSSGTVWSEDEKVGQVLTIGTLDQRHLLSYSPVQCELLNGFTASTSPYRVFGWMSPQSSYWYNSADWVAPTSLGALGAKGWPVPTRVQLITADTTPTVDEVWLARSTLPLVSPHRLRIRWLADDIATLYVNSVALAICPPGGATRVNEIELPAGTHTIAFEVKNTKPSQTKIAACVTFLDNNNKDSTVLRYTDTTHWKVHKVVSGVYPGWTAAGIFLKLLAESQALGAFGAAALTPDFTSTHDSAGVAWPHIEPAQVFKVGTPLSDVATTLEELAFDLHIKGDGTIQAFVTQGIDVSATVAILPGLNLKRLDYQGSPVQGTVAIIQTANGYVEVDDSGAQALYGDRYMSITSGDSGNLAQGQRLGSAALADGDHPRYPVTATITVVDGAVPFRDFNKGDTVTSLLRKNVVGKARVMSISVSTSQDTPTPAFVLELEPL